MSHISFYKSVQRLSLAGGVFALAACSGAPQDNTRSGNQSARLDSNEAFFDEFDNGLKCPWTSLSVTPNRESAPVVTQQYSQDDAYVDNGNLVLRAQQYDDGTRTSGVVTTAGKYSFTYGYVEVRAQIPRVNGASSLGVYPAFGLVDAGCTDDFLGRGRGCQRVPEIDLYDQIYWDTGKFSPSGPTIQSKIIMPAGTSGSTIHGCNFPVDDYSTDFHVWGIGWKPDSVTLTYDGVEYCSMSGAGKVPSSPMFIFIDTSVGQPNADVSFPVYQLIDYVHVTPYPG